MRKAFTMTIFDGFAVAIFVLHHLRPAKFPGSWIIYPWILEAVILTAWIFFKYSGLQEKAMIWAARRIIRVKALIFKWRILRQSRKK